MALYLSSHLWREGVGAGVINAQLDSVMSRKLRLSTVPAVVAVVGAKLHWFDRHFSVQHLRDFVRGLYPPDLIQEVRCGESVAFSLPCLTFGVATRSLLLRQF